MPVADELSWVTATIGTCDMNESDRHRVAIIFLIAIAAMLVFGIVLGNYLARQDMAHEVCVTYGYDMGDYTDGEILCSYKLDVPLDELAPYFAPTPQPESGAWSEEGQAL